jgi:uncharacterized protein with HEPN domain
MMYLNDMIEAAQLAMSFAAGLKEEAFTPKQMAYEAILRQLEIIGEAASHIPPDIQAKGPEILWRDMIALRNRLAHAYFAIERDILWNLVTAELPSTHANLTRLRETLRQESQHG